MPWLDYEAERAVTRLGGLAPHAFNIEGVFPIRSGDSYLLSWPCQPGVLRLGHVVLHNL